MMPRILGIDAGSVAISAVETDEKGELLRRAYRFHNGRPAEVLAGILDEWSLGGTPENPAAESPFPGWSAVHATRSASVLVSDPGATVDDRVAMMAAAGRIHGTIGSLLVVGGEEFGLFSWSGEGRYRNFKGNTSCAAGTGGFLDQQAERLGLGNAAELAALALKNAEEPPRIATRCSVFAKTDLIHAQQEGYSLEAIADGLCRGLAGNLLDVLLDGEPPAEPLVLCGGVSLNAAVAGHIADLTGVRPVVDELAPFYGALGAVWKTLDDGRGGAAEPPLRKTAEEVVAPAVGNPRDDGFRYPPLALELSPYPDFSCAESWEVPVEGRKGRYPVEVEIFEPLPAEGEAILGMDIGSTSTKAVIVDSDGIVLAGFYTRTAGRPVEAAKAVLMALEGAVGKYESVLRVAACASTGSGRKLIGEILGADLILDEITAHARAAVSLDPAVDTIIEIGGQDAKFTTLSEGRVTGSVMNNVCAAGTGSFLEEQASRLGCAITDYADRTEGVAAPLTSDRCTVFMQRDLNHLMAEGYAVEDVLASALHSVRENYLNKVAVRNRIGNTVFFQGATARIRTLVAAFEQALGKPILVSRYCRHTGALGAALQLMDERREESSRSAPIPGAVGAASRFRGTGLWKEDIPVRTETCRLCRNACKLTLADVAGETVAYGFLCGRDYGTERFVPKAGEGSDPLSERKRLFAVDPREAGAARSGAHPLLEKGLAAVTGKSRERARADDRETPLPTIGLPAALYMAGELPFWEKFFALLGYPTVVDRDTDPIERGKALAGAEFCAPMTALHGRVSRLLETTDYVFVPFYLDEKGPKGDKRSYCYYSQFAPSLIRQIAPEERILTPVVKTAWKDGRGKSAVREALASLPGPPPDARSVTAAWETARKWFDATMSLLRGFHAERALEDDVNVVLLGRPYVVADAGMNKDIPKLFAEQGVRVFDMDMLPESGGESLPWNYAARIMEQAERIADMKGTYPVLITSFMCSPDSFTVPYVRELWDGKGKPYLVLELDGHGSSVGYATRVEAAVRAFRNHFGGEGGGGRETPPGNPGEKGLASTAEIRGKTLLIPNWDADVMPLVTANLRREGIDARVLEETDELVRQGSRNSDGQCLPLSIIARETAAYVRKHNLDPGKTALFMIRSNWSCNIPLYPRHILHLLAKEGGGMDRVRIHIDTIGFTGTSPLGLVGTYYAYMFGGLIKRIACRIRPYEANPGETDRVLAMARDRLVKVFSGRGDRMAAAKDIVRRFESIPTVPGRKPKAAIFGDVYVRDNAVMNQDLIRAIEAAGGEVVTMPYNRYAKMIADSHFKRLFKEKRYKALAGWKLFLQALKIIERSYDALFAPLAGPEETYGDDPESILAPYGVTPEHHGESMENLLKIHYLASRHDDLALFVQTSPSFCCAGLVTEAMRKKIEEVTGIPVLSITYDGTGGNKNDVVAPYFAFPREGEADDSPAERPRAAIHR